MATSKKVVKKPTAKKTASKKVTYDTKYLYTTQVPLIFAMAVEAFILFIGYLLISLKI